MNITFTKKDIWKLFIPPIAFVFIMIYYLQKYSKFRMVAKGDVYQIKVSKLDSYQNHIFINDSIKIGTCYDVAKPNPNHLIHHISLGDSIVKLANQDTVWLFKTGASPRFFIIKQY